VTFKHTFMAKSVCMRYYKFLNATEINPKLCTPGLNTKPPTGRKQGLRILLLCCHRKCLESDASSKNAVHVRVILNCIQ